MKSYEEKIAALERQGLSKKEAIEAVERAESIGRSLGRKQKREPSPLDRLSDAYENHRGLRLSPSEVQILVQSDNALQSLIEEWSK